MKTCSRLLIFLLFILAATGCHKKDETYPKIYPGSYFPVYPGSWWKYQVVDYTTSDTVELTWQTSSGYAESQYQTGPDTWSDYKLVPYLDGVPIYGYSRISCYEYYKCALFPFISEKTGDEFYWPPVTRYQMTPPTLWRVIGKSTDSAQDSILTIRGKDLDSTGTITWSIYKKNVGLVLQCILEQMTGDTLKKQYLVDSYISFKKE